MCRCFCNCKILHARPCCVFVSCTVILIFVAAGVAISFYWSDISGNSGKRSWNCSYSSCGICKDIEEPSIDLHSTMCANITYLSEDRGYLYIVSANESTIVNDTVTDPSAPPACLRVDENAKACMHLYDMSASNSTLHICAQIQTAKKLNVINKYELGCIDVHPITRKNNTLNETDHVVVAV